VPITPEYLARSGTEHGEQAAVFCWAALNRLAYPGLRWMFAIPNGGGRSMAQGNALKAEGVKGGVADICWPQPNRRHGELMFHGLYIEMKRADGVPSDVSADQFAFGAHVTLQGYAWYVAFGWQQAIAIITRYAAGELPELSPHQQKVHEKMMELVNATP
jgi:hypothetical protein